jgi:hypothetical protein
MRSRGCDRSGHGSGHHVSRERGPTGSQSVDAFSACAAVIGPHLGFPTSGRGTDGIMLADTLSGFCPPRERTELPLAGGMQRIVVCFAAWQCRCPDECRKFGRRGGPRAALPAPHVGQPTDAGNPETSHACPMVRFRARRAAPAGSAMPHSALPHPDGTGRAAIIGLWRPTICHRCRTLFRHRCSVSRIGSLGRASIGLTGVTPGNQSWPVEARSPPGSR